VRRHHRVEVEPLDPLLFDLDHWTTNPSGKILARSNETGMGKNVRNNIAPCPHHTAGTHSSLFKHFAALAFLVKHPRRPLFDLGYGR
jgi:hypothetical protein